MIQEKYFTFKSNDGLTEISCKYWIPENEPVAVLQLSHGMIEYKERYDAFARLMAENGFLVSANDHLGHGDSVTSKEKWGFMTKDKPSDVIINDMNELRNITSKDYPGIPYFILGHSMGSYMLRKYLAFYGEGLNGAIIMGTGQAGTFASSIALFLVSVVAAFKGWEHRSSFIQGLTVNKSYDGYDLTGKEPERSWLTRDTEIVKKYYKDPKCTYRFTLSGHKGLFEATKFDGNDENAKLIPKELPLLLISGEKDPVGDLGVGVKKVEAQLKKAGIMDVTTKLYSDCRHEVLNEINKSEVYDDILGWLKSHM